MNCRFKMIVIAIAATIWGGSETQGQVSLRMGDQSARVAQQVDPIPLQDPTKVPATTPAPAALTTPAVQTTPTPVNSGGNLTIPVPAPSTLAPAPQPIPGLQQTQPSPVVNAAPPMQQSPAVNSAPVFLPQSAPTFSPAPIASAPMAQMGSAPVYNTRQNNFATRNRPSINVGGWLSGGYTTYDTGMFNNHPENVDLNQAWVYAEKVADGSDGFDMGFRVDYVYGTDGPDTQAFGNTPDTFDFGWNHGGFYGQAIPQAYLEFASGDISVKVGHFFTLIGYEVVAAPDNFFYSHAYTMFNSEPFTHTGALATADLGDVTVYGGYVLGWDSGFEDNGGSQFIGGLSFALGKYIDLTYIALAGDQGFGTDRSGYNHSVVASVALTDQLTYVLHHDLVDYSGTTGGEVRAYSVNNYVLYDLSETVGVGLRGEWWSPEVAPGDYRDIFQFTAGLNLRIADNVVIRPEARYDHDPDGVVGAPNEDWGFGVDAVISFGG